MSPSEISHVFLIGLIVYFAVAGLIAVITWSDIRTFVRLGGHPDTVVKGLALWPFNLAKGLFDWQYKHWFRWRYGPRKK